jgi:hypothetical protein
MILILAHVLPADGMFMPKHVRVSSLLLYVYDIMHSVGCNDRMYCMSLSTLDTSARLWPHHTLQSRGIIKIWQERYILPPQRGLANLHWSWGYRSVNTGGNETAWNTSVLEKSVALSRDKKFLAFMEHEISVPCSQKYGAGPIYLSHESEPYPHVIFI